MEPKNSLLIVDDEVSNLQMLSHILGSAYTIYTAKNGVNAIEKARMYSPDLILLDIVMPGMDGYQVLSELRNVETTRKIPIIFITGLSSIDDEKKGLSLNAVDYISKPFSPMIVQLRVRNQIQIVNQLRTIEELSMRDQLTGLPNRRSFDDVIQSEWKRATRESEPISVLVMDIDKFKSYNDAHGHQQGDVALRAVAGVIPRSLKRPSDFAGRWGGEEFVVLLPNTPIEGALEIAEDMRRNVENEEIPLEDGSVSKVTVSIGVNAQFPRQGGVIDAFVAKADKAMFAAKTSGKNRIIRAETAD